MAISLADVRSSAEVVRQYNFEFIVPNLPSGGGAGGIASAAVGAISNAVGNAVPPAAQGVAQAAVSAAAGALGIGGDSLRVRVLNAEIPGFGNEPFETSQGGHIRKHAGRRSHPRTLSVTYYEGVDMSVYKAFQNWHDLQWNPDTGVQAADSVYKTTALLRVLSYNKSVIRTFTMEGCWVEDVGNVSVDYSSSESVQVAVSFSYDIMTAS